MTQSTSSLAGIHHVTAITADAQKNIDFYCGLLGLRLVKVTVNFDDPTSYHLYYGDQLGHPGTILTFFVWPGAHRGTVGPPQVTATAFRVPQSASEFWRTRLTDKGLTVGTAVHRFGEEIIPFADPDGMRLEIVATDQPGTDAWAAWPVPIEHAIRGFHGITIAEEGYESTARLLTDVMGYKADGSDDNRFRFRASAGFAATVDLLCTPGSPHGTMGAGTVHHVAYRTADDPQQLAWQAELSRLDFNVSPVMDRNYFHSIYFREPGGVLFEIATDNPGFTVDEPAEEFATKLKLPSQFEPYRAEIERVLPPVRLPTGILMGRAR
jgi:catechol 2,3-dioxygenase-like lactoylglutathione lyase family enzyme